MDNNSKQQETNQSNIVSVLAIIIAVVSLFISLGTSERRSTDNTSEMELLRTELNSNERFTKYLGDRITTLQERLVNLEYFPPLHSTVFFTPAMEGFQRIETSVGDVFVSIKNIEPYNSGKRIVFDVGNPLAAEILSVKASLSFGKSFASYKSNLSETDVALGKATYEEWNKSLRTVEKDVLEGLKPRAWNKLSFVLSPAKDEDLETLRLYISADGIYLYQPTR